MSHSLIVPRHLAAAREAARMDPGVEVHDRAKRPLEYDDKWFEDEKQNIRDRCGWVLDKMRVTLNHILVAIFVRPEKTAGGIINPYAVRDDDIYRGTAGLVLKLGPRCFEDSDVMTWTEADKFEVGDWVMFRRGDANGFRVSVNGVECINFESERGIKLVVPRPDLFY